MLNSPNEHLQHLIEIARKKAEREKEKAIADRRAKEKEAREIIATCFEDAADIAFQGIHEGLNANTCQQIAAALRLQAALVRGDVHET